MTGRGEGAADATGGPARHLPVLLAEVSNALLAERGGLYVDGTFGAGGYTGALLAAHPDTRVIAIDRDPDAIAGGADLVARSDGRLALVPGRFSDIERIVAETGATGVDGVVLDIGVSSMQIDQADRGFSFRWDGPLDMRMERDGPSAADLVNGAAEADLADILYYYGEERRARVIARAIIERRRRAPITGTAELVELVSKHVRSEPGLNPATRTFQALRIAVNDELMQLVEVLHAAERILKPGGRLAVVTFHSLEDRIVKQFLAARTSRTARASRHVPSVEAAQPTFNVVVRGPIVAAEAELARNPRARSAKLRVAERNDAPPGEVLSALTDLASLPHRATGRETAR
jgi:16S rRNA (cytosine1402-N4)-methyltransferase